MRMPDITQTIMAEIEADPAIKATDIGLDIESRGLLKKKKFLHVRGAVHSQDQVDRVEKIVQRHAGDSYEVVNHLLIK